ncbi:MAG: ATP-NAD kinase family protein [Alphaproteobacteria bacterium]
MNTRPRLGLIVNPIAGMGGPLGLKGTDGEAILARALAMGAMPMAAARAQRALVRLAMAGVSFDLLTAPGAMGGGAAREAGFPIKEIGTSKERTSAADTRDATKGLARAGVALILFAGGDGTARDVLEVVGGTVAVLGIPSGVKMQSAVFATNPEAAGELAAAFLGGARRTRHAEVMDIDEEAVRAGRISPRLYGYALVPEAKGTVQGPKSGASAEDDAELDAACARIAREAEPGTLFIVGPGTTMRRLKARLGAEGTLLGVDAFESGRLVVEDADERLLLALLDGKPARIVVGVVGGQGFLFGRGNQPISPAVIRGVGRANIIAVAGAEKLLRLDPPGLRVDTGDPATDRMLEGYWPVQTGPRRTMIVKVTA